MIGMLIGFIVILIACVILTVMQFLDIRIKVLYATALILCVFGATVVIFSAIFYVIGTVAMLL